MVQHVVERLPVINPLRWGDKAVNTLYSLKEISALIHLRLKCKTSHHSRCCVKQHGRIEAIKIITLHHLRLGWLC